MTRIALTSAFVLGCIFAVLVGCHQPSQQQPTVAKPPQAPGGLWSTGPGGHISQQGGIIVTTKRHSDSGVGGTNALAGHYLGPGYDIHWQGKYENPASATPLDVLKACSERLQRMQSTELGSDANARALFAVEEAIDHLTDTADVTHKPPVYER